MKSPVTEGKREPLPPFKKSKVQILLSDLLEPENPVLNTEIYSKWKKLFCIDVNSYVIEFLWGHNCLSICSFPGTILHLPKWSVEKAEWPALPGCASDLIIALFVGIFLLCSMRRTASFPNSPCHYWPGPGYFKELCCWWSFLWERVLRPCLRSQAQQWPCVTETVNIRCSLVAAHPDACVIPGHCGVLYGSLATLHSALGFGGLYKWRTKLVYLSLFLRLPPWCFWFLWCIALSLEKEFVSCLTLKTALSRFWCLSWSH